MKSKFYKWCAVPLCKNTSKATPNKLFVYVPHKKIVRDKWLKLARRAPASVTPSSPMYFCEDHFDLPNDMENYMQYHVMGSVSQVRMKPNCFPKKFACQPDRKTQTCDTAERPYISKNQKILSLEGCEKQIEESSVVKEHLDLEEIASGSSVTNRKEMSQEKVFQSNITRTHNEIKNNLYDMLTIESVKPLSLSNDKNLNCDFVPKTDKQFTPKKKLRLKVKTVRNIRHLYEKDVYETLDNDLEKQQNTLLRRIRGGSSKHEKTIQLAKSLLKNEKPISRVAWQMVINVNPEEHTHPLQYVLWNGKHIQVNGSRGGKSKFICQYGLGGKRKSLLQRHELKQTNFTIMKKSLLKQSLNVNFKPGPLSLKKQLDISYQKYNIGNIELAHLPKPGLEITPEYDKPLQSSVMNFLHQLRDANGTISEKWAEFALSTLGTENNGRAVQLNQESITFDLNYKNNQHRLLMRNDVDSLSNKNINQQIMSNPYIEDEDTELQVQNILDRMLNYVEINLLQNDMYTREDDPREINAQDLTVTSDTNPKRKGELNRLDVTIIRLSDNQQKKIDVCRKSFCALGCICDSLNCTFHFKNHCGRIECMFECTCDFSKYVHDYFEDTFIPEIVNLDKINNLKLSKEQQKFHQTVVMSGERSILLKSLKRNWKAPDKYAEFYSNTHLKTNKKRKQILSVVDVNLNCTNVEPWCMVHNLYKCFCKGKFTERSCNNISNDVTKSIENNISNNNSISIQSVESSSNLDESLIKSSLRPRANPGFKNMNTTKTILPLTEQSSSNICARTQPYQGRKYSHMYYLNANNKIKEMEQNDHNLSKRINNIIKNYKNCDNSKTDNSTSIDLEQSDESQNRIEQSDETQNKIEQSDESQNKIEQSDESQNKIEQSDESQNKIEEENPVSVSSPINSSEFDDTPRNILTSANEHPLNSKIKSWLEPILKTYRSRFNKGFLKKSLDPPKAGKVALYPWDFILDRYNRRKNFFLVTNKKPFRIFMAVDNNHPLFKNCTNVSNITNLEEYPVSVKNLVTNKISGLENQICILRGLNFCWELFGSVKKVIENNANVNSSKASSSNIDSLTLKQTLSSSPPFPSSTSTSLENNTEYSKWFVLTIEDDFTEIQFYNRGFFVKYESIINAIKVARFTEKTVRLSSQKSMEGNTDPQFGIYAIPNANEYCVFIGPYEKNEPLGIETIKTASYSEKNRTRGVWITTNKIDNLRVIDSPLSFMSQVHLENEEFLDDSLQIDSKEPVSNTQQNKNKIVRLTKPIKIAKNKFYHLTSTGLLKPLQTSPEKQTIPSLILNKTLSCNVEPNTVPLLCKGSKVLYPSTIKNNNSTMKELTVTSNRPIAEIAPHVKVIKESTERKDLPSKLFTGKFDGNMFILKPEDINKRSLLHNSNSELSPLNNNDNTITMTDDNALEMDIESFLAKSPIRSESCDDVCVISDDEDITNPWSDVWIVCKNVENIGWIAGRQDASNRLSFEFPGFKYTEFYTEEEAFAKINQVFARKMYIPKNFDLLWSVVKAKEDLKNIQKLKPKDLGPDYVLSKQGLNYKLSAVKLKTDSEDLSLENNVNRTEKMEQKIKESPTKEAISELESSSMEKQCDQLCSMTEEKKKDFSKRVSKMSNERRQEISDRLRSILSRFDGS